MKIYDAIVKRYEKNLEQHGDHHLSLEWPNELDMAIRYKVMLDVVTAKPCTLLDFGCGLSDLYTHMIKNRVKEIEYIGLDISPKFIEVCKKKYPNICYLCCDVLETPIPSFDFIVANGILTVKDQLTFDEMWEYSKFLLLSLFKYCNAGLAINFMSKHVDWELEKLFHLPMDTLANFITKNLTKHFSFRQDYGLYEYTAYILK